MDKFKPEQRDLNRADLFLTGTRFKQSGVNLKTNLTHAWGKQI